MKRCGYIAIVGRPNVGKSTLMNYLLGQKLSITAHKPQTTRHSILGIHTQDDVQCIFIDTPGIHMGGKRALNRVLNKTAQAAIQDADAIVMIVQASDWTDEDQLVFDRVKNLKTPVFLTVNKIDRLNEKQELLPYLANLPDSENIQEVIPISARKGQNVARLEALITEALPPGDHFFAEDQITDRSSRFLAAELVREQLTRFLSKELPYALSVEIEQFERSGGVDHISALIWVEKKSQKGIIIGKGGERLKEIGKRSRVSMEKLFGNKVYLQLWVKIKSGWADDERTLRSLGYTDTR
ncbi:MAG TPA: GTPase Era [Gammaproteobacteria bacterium]|nr:GTPase Era [Gammaproteobacteria bacterium]